MRKTTSALLLVIVSCAEPAPPYLAITPPGHGPKVVWDLTKRPLPEIPFPNNAATRTDPTSETGRRLNISALAATDLEMSVRVAADRLDGFGTFSPITVSFDAPLDLDVIRERHKDLDFSNDAVFVFDVTPQSPDFGKPVMLDLGRGFFPVTLRDPEQYFEGDPRAGQSNLLFETVDESGGEDTDFDQVSDRPNTLGPDTWNDLLTWYEKETNTLIMRPVVPLRERTTYAVVLTRRLVGQDGEPVRSPFPYVHHADQYEEIAPLSNIVRNYGLKVEDIAFAWTFTTQSITSALLTIRQGLYGYGPMARLAQEFPARYEAFVLRTGPADMVPSVIKMEELLKVVGPLLPAFAESVPSLKESMKALIESYDSVDMIFGGTFQSPNFLVDKDGLATPGYPANDDESFDVDVTSGRATYGMETVPFVCAIPKERPEYRDPAFPELQIKKPFPVAIFVHGTAASKVQALGYAGPFARLGIATCGIDSFAHGMPFPKNVPEGTFLSDATVRGLVQTMFPEYAPIVDFLAGTRARDVTGDGNEDPGGDFWTADPLHTRDTVRQTVVDLMQFVRVLRAMDGKTTADVDGDGEKETLGDLDEDGVVDIGGPENRYFAWGISLGGIVTALFAGVEPALAAAVVQSGGGGLSDVAIRSSQPGVPQMVVQPVLGTMFVLSWAETGGLLVKAAVPVLDRVEYHVLGRLEHARPGVTVRVINLDSGELREVRVPGQDRQAFRVQIQADALRPSEIRAFLGFDPIKRIGGEACKVSDDCERPLVCRDGQCTCSGSKCPTGFSCNNSGICVFDAYPVDTTVATQKHPALGDRIRFEVIGADGRVLEVFEHFQQDVRANGIVYPAGAPLVALFRGYGYERQTPGFRRFIGIAQALLDAGDPINVARAYLAEPLVQDGHGTPVLIIGVAGDNNVPIATGIALARAAGFLGYLSGTERLGGNTEMDVLVEKGVVEGLANRCRYKTRVQGHAGEIEKCVVYDPDDLDESRTFTGCECEETADGWICKDRDGRVCGDGFGLPFDLPTPLRATVVREKGVLVDGRRACVQWHADGTCRVFRHAGGIGALRIVVTRPEGFHGLYLMSPFKPFDVETYQLNLFARFFMTSGRELVDDLCLADSSCEWIW